MDENRLRFGVGVLVVASVGITVILTFFFGAYPNLFADRYTVIVRFPKAPGVSVDTPVLKNGVRIGRVIDTKLLTGTAAGAEDGVLLTLEIDDSYPLRLDQVPRVTSGSLITGDAQIEFVRASDNQLLRMYDGQAGEPADNALDANERALAEASMSDGSYLEWGEVETDPFDVLVGLEDDVRATLVTIQQAGQAIETAGRSVDRLTTQVEDAIGGEGELGNLSERTGRMIDNFDLALQELRTVVGDPEMQAALRAAIQRFPGVLDEAQVTLQSTQRTLESFERVGAAAERTVRSAEKTADNIARFTEPLAENGEELVAALLRSLENFDRTVVQFSDFGTRISGDGGTLGLLMEDKELYYQIKRVMDNVEGASVQIRPILEDVRVLSDKLARDPRQLGVKGALDHRPSGLGLK